MPAKTRIRVIDLRMKKFVPVRCSCLLLFFGILSAGSTVHGQSKADAMQQLLTTKGLVALWDFKEEEGQPRNAHGVANFPLKEQNGTLPRISEGPWSGYSTLFGNKAFLSLPNAQLGKLNIYGKNQGVTVMAWVKWTGEQPGFVGGIWNEYLDGGKRQYGLFVSLPHYNGRNQVCGHISQTGKPTPPFPYSIDYSASAQTVPSNEWCCVAFTYDSAHVRTYFNGIFEARVPEPVINQLKSTFETARHYAISH